MPNDLDDIPASLASMTTREAAIARAYYARGQEDMRERAAREVWDIPCDHGCGTGPCARPSECLHDIASSIHALPVEEAGDE